MPKNQNFKMQRKAQGEQKTQTYQIDRQVFEHLVTKRCACKDDF
jgi:hypothetical protein